MWMVGAAALAAGSAMLVRQTALLPCVFIVAWLVAGRQLGSAIASLALFGVIGSNRLLLPIARRRDAVYCDSAGYQHGLNRGRSLC